MSEPQLPSQNQPPAPHPAAPLQYFNPTGPAPTHPAVLTLITIGGTMLGCGLTCAAVLGAAMAIASINDKAPRAGVLAFGGTVIFLGICALGLLVRSVAGGKRLPLEKRRRGPRFLLLGLLIGCGLTCLVQGVCFAALNGQLANFSESRHWVI